LYCTKCIDGYTLDNGNCLLNNSKKWYIII
jgi:hypothetical protein